jgi:two-component system sensor histidine kinase UhpB
LVIHRDSQFDEDTRPHPIRAYFGALVLVVLIPGLLIAGWLAYLSATSERIQIQQDATQRAREIAAAIDHEIVGAQNLLAVLASSHALQTGDFEAFHRQLVEISRQLNMHIVLRDPLLDRQVVNAAIPWGQDIPGKVTPDIARDEQEALRIGKPVVSNVFFASGVRKHMVCIVMPVVTEDKRLYFLALGLPLAIFGQILDRMQPDPNRIGAVVDRQGVIVARSEKHDEFAGTFIKNPPKAESDSVISGVTRHGVLFHWFRVRSEVSGWFISVGIANHVLEAPVNFAVTSFAVAGGALLMVAVAVASLLGGRLSHSIGTLRSAAVAARKYGREQFEILFEAVPNGIVAVDASGLIVQVNKQIEKTFGYSRRELIDQPIELLLPLRHRAEHATTMATFIADPQDGPMAVGCELLGRRKDGSLVPVEIGMNRIATSAGELTMATVTDITERRKAEAERGELRRRILQSQEQERLRLAHELHDRTGQELTAAMLELRSIEAETNQDGRDRIRRLRHRLDRMGQSLHHVAWELRPASFEELGMASAFAAYVSDWSDQYGIAADFHCRDAKIDDLAVEVRITLYRVLQEALTNVAKHAVDAKSVSVVIDRIDSTLRLTIEDDGGGFESISTSDVNHERRGGLGHAGMRERLALIGGQIEIESSIGVGTTIYVRIPLVEREAVA